MLQGLCLHYSPLRYLLHPIFYIAHDFFQPQPVKDAAVFFMRVVLHDWPTTSCRAIMQNLRSAASPSTKLILYESTMPYACEAPSGFTDDKQAPPRPPYPLLLNLGSVMGNFLTMVDMQVRFLSCLLRRGRRRRGTYYVPLSL